MDTIQVRKFELELGHGYFRLKDSHEHTYEKGDLVRLRDALTVGYDPVTDSPCLRDYAFDWFFLGPSFIAEDSTRDEPRVFAVQQVIEEINRALAAPPPSMWTYDPNGWSGGPIRHVNGRRWFPWNLTDPTAQDVVKKAWADAPNHAVLTGLKGSGEPLRAYFAGGASCLVDDSHPAWKNKVRMYYQECEEEFRRTGRVRRYEARSLDTETTHYVVAWERA